MKAARGGAAVHAGPALSVGGARDGGAGQARRAPAPPLLGPVRWRSCPASPHAQQLVGAGVGAPGADQLARPARPRTRREGAGNGSSLDSFIEGLGLRDEDVIPRQVERRLRRLACRRIEVVNAGVTSYSPILQYLLLQHVGLRLAPDLVVLNFDMTDVHDDVIRAGIARLGPDGLPLAVPATREEAALLLPPLPLPRPLGPRQSGLPPGSSSIGTSESPGWASASSGPSSSRPSAWPPSG